MSNLSHYQRRNLEFYKSSIESEYKISVASKVKVFINNSKIPLFIANFILVYITTSDAINYPNKHKIQKYVAALSVFSLFLSGLPFIFNRLFKNELLISIEAIFLNFLITIPFQIISGLFSTSFSHSGDPVLIVYSVEILIRYYIVIFYCHVFEYNLISGIMNVLYLWMSSILFHSKLNSTVFCYLVINTITNFSMILFVYYYDLKTKESFEMIQFFKYESEYFLEIFDEMKKGIVIINDSQLLLYNNFISQLSESVQKNCKEIRNEKDRIMFFLKFLLKNFENFYENVPDELISFLKDDNEINFENLQSIIEKNNIYSNFKALGSIKVTNQENQEMFFQVNLRFKNKIEILVLDITKTCVLERSKALYLYKSLYLAKIAHEFKNPLLTIISLCKNNKNLEENKEIVLTESLCSYLLFLIENLNYFSKEKKQREIEKKDENYDVSKALDFSCSIFEVRLKNDEKKKNIKIIKDYSKSLPKINIPETRLKQVVINLLSNSYKFTLGGSIKISAKIKNDLQNSSNFLRFVVKDTGVGIPQNYQKFLLDSDDVVVENQAFNQYGSGFGLKIIQEILAEYDSKLMFESEINNGSKFWFDFPVSSHENCTKNKVFKSRTLISMDSNDTIIINNQYFCKLNCKEYNGFESEYLQSINEKEDALEKEEIIDEFENSFGANLNENLNKFENKKCIIICDDEQFIRRSIRHQIEQLGTKLDFPIEIDEANNGVEALYMICENASMGKITHALIIDETMPYMSGSQCISNLRSMMNMSLINQIKICSITSYLDDENLERIKRSGCDSIIVKPPIGSSIENFLKSLENLEN